MTNDISIALKTLRLDPEDPKALEILSSFKVPETAEATSEDLGKALAAERAFHAETNHPRLCIRLVQIEIALATEPSVRAALLVDKARIEWSELWEMTSARESLQKALEMVPNFPAAAALLRELETEDSNWQEQAESLSAQATEAGERPAAAPFFASEGDLLLRHRDTPDEAEAMFRRALQLDPQNKHADFAMERLLLGRHVELAELLARRSANAATPAEKGAAELAAGKLAEKMGDRAQAQEHYRQSLLANPGDERTYYTLDKLFAVTSDVSDLVKIYEAALRAAKRGTAEIPAAMALGELHWKRLNKMEEAEQAFRRVKKAQPYHPKVIAFYREYYLSRDEIPSSLLCWAKHRRTKPTPR